MARNRKAKKTAHRRHRRRSSMRGISDVATHVAAVVAGAAAGAYSNNMLKTSLTSLPTWAPGAIVVAAGIFIPKLVKGNAMVDGFATGLTAAGGVFVLNETFLSIPGISGITLANREYKGKPALQRSVGAPGFFDNPIGSVKMRDLNTIGALYDN